MKLLKRICSDYLHGLVFFIIVFYFMTANPDGSMPLKWSFVNVYWTISFLIAYPLLLETVPSIKKINFHMKSLQSRSIHMEDKATKKLSDLYHDSTNPVSNRIDLQARSDYQNDWLNLMISFFVSGLLIAISIPSLFFIAFKNLLGRRMLWKSFHLWKVDCKINPNAVREKYQLPLKWCLPQAHFLGADFLSSITYSERIKIETFCELGLSNIQMDEWLKRFWLKVGKNSNLGDKQKILSLVFFVWFCCLDKFGKQVLRLLDQTSTKLTWLKTFPSMGAVYCICTTTFQAKTATTLKTLHDRIILYVERRILSPRWLALVHRSTIIYYT